MPRHNPSPQIIVSHSMPEFNDRFIKYINKLKLPLSLLLVPRLNTNAEISAFFGWKSYFWAQTTQNSMRFRQKNNNNKQTCFRVLTWIVDSCTYLAFFTASLKSSWNCGKLMKLSLLLRLELDTLAALEFVRVCFLWVSLSESSSSKLGI